MYCLHCGDCCRRMSPISHPAPCPHIVEIQGLTFCGIYESRPKQCRDHDFPASKCPIGVDVMGCKTPQEAHEKINLGYAIINAGLNPVEQWGL